MVATAEKPAEVLTNDKKVTRVGLTRIRVPFGDLFVLAFKGMSAISLVIIIWGIIPWLLFGMIVAGSK
jgi:hypothetical protein